MTDGRWEGATFYFSLFREGNPVWRFQCPLWGSDSHKHVHLEKMPPSSFPSWPFCEHVSWTLLLFFWFPLCPQFPSMFSHDSGCELLHGVWPSSSILLLLTFFVWGPMSAAWLGDTTSREGLGLLLGSQCLGLRPSKHWLCLSRASDVLLTYALAQKKPQFPQRTSLHVCTVSEGLEAAINHCLHSSHASRESRTTALDGVILGLRLPAPALSWGYGKQWHWACGLPWGNPGFSKGLPCVLAS